MKKKLNKKYIEETPLDDYERELQEFLDRCELVSDPNFAENKKMFEEAARIFIELE